MEEFDRFGAARAGLGLRRPIAAATMESTEAEDFELESGLRRPIAAASQGRFGRSRNPYTHSDLLSSDVSAESEEFERRFEDESRAGLGLWRPIAAARNKRFEPPRNPYTHPELCCSYLQFESKLKTESRADPMASAARWELAVALVGRLQ